MSLSDASDSKQSDPMHISNNQGHKVIVITNHNGSASSSSINSKRAWKAFKLISFFIATIAVSVAIFCVFRHCGLIKISSDINVIAVEREKKNDNAILNEKIEKIPNGDHFKMLVEERTNSDSFQRMISTMVPTSQPVARYHPPHFRIIILTFDRNRSLQRLLHSLSNANYTGDVIDLDIFIDRASPPNATINEDVLNTSISFSQTWMHGKATVHQRPVNYGLARQWLESWQDSLPDDINLGDDPRERALILEDDIAVSPFFYIWLKAAHEKYQSRPDVAGFTLQRLNFCPSNCPNLNGGPFAAKTNFLSPLVGTWGYAPIASMWAEFVPWVETQLRMGVKPYVTGAREVTNWYKAFERTKRCPGPMCMWSIWHMKWAETRIGKRRYTVYTRCPDRTTLASNFKESGLHYSSTMAQDFLLFTNKDKLQRILEFSENPTVINWMGRIERDPDPVAAKRLATLQAVQPPQSDKLNMLRAFLRRFDAKSLETYGKKIVLFTFIDSSLYSAFWDFYETSILPFNIFNFVVVATDPEVYNKLIQTSITENDSPNERRRKMLPWPHVIKHDRAGSFTPGGRVAYGTEAFNEKDKLKLSITRDALMVGYEVMVTDVDVKFFDNPMKSEYTSEMKDVSAMSDCTLNDRGGEQISGSFYYVRPTIRSVSFFHDVVWSGAAHEDWNVQDTFTEMDPYGLVSVLPRNRYLCGASYFEWSRRMFWDEKGKSDVQYEVVRTRATSTNYQTKNAYYASSRYLQSMGTPIVVHNNWLNGNDAKQYRWKEHMWSRDDSNNYYSSTTAKYITYDNQDETNTFEEESNALRIAFSIAKITDRILVLPKFHCHKCEVKGIGARKGGCDGGFGENVNRCNILSNWHVESLNREFGIESYRESSFFHHLMVPDDVKESAGVLANTEKNNATKPVRISLVTSNRKARLDSQGTSFVFGNEKLSTITPEELLRWISSNPRISQAKVITFDSLFSIFGKNFELMQDQEWLQKLSKGVQKCNYRQLSPEYECPSSIPFV